MRGLGAHSHDISAVLGGHSDITLISQLRPSLLPGLLLLEPLLLWQHALVQDSADELVTIFNPEEAHMFFEFNSSISRSNGFAGASHEGVL